MNCWKTKSDTLELKDRDEIRAYIKTFKDNHPVTCAVFCHTLQCESVEALVAMVQYYNWPVFLPILCVALRKYVKYQRMVSRHRNLLLKKNINVVIIILGSYFSHACPCAVDVRVDTFFYHMTVVTCTRFKVYFLNILYKKNFFCSQQKTLLKSILEICLLPPF